MKQQTISLPLIGIMAVVTGITFQQGIGAVYEVCDAMTGDENYTHQLIRASKEVTPALLEQFPWLRTVQADVEQLRTEHGGGKAPIICQLYTPTGTA